MIVPFDTLAPTSRVWIYQCERELTPLEEQHISEKIEKFMPTWQSHGSDIKVSYNIKYQRFIILSVDEDFKEVSGCSIDSSVKFLQSLEEELEATLLDKMQIAFRSNATIASTTMAEFPSLVKNGTINAETIVFNNIVKNKLELENNWEVPVNKSWHKRYLV